MSGALLICHAHGTELHCGFDPAVVPWIALTLFGFLALLAIIAFATIRRR